MKTLNIKYSYFLSAEHHARYGVPSMTHIQMCSYFIRCYAAILLHDGFSCCSALWYHYSVCLTGSRRVCYRTDAVHELPIPPVHLL